MGFLLALGLTAVIVMWAAAGARAATTLTVTSTADDAGNQPCANAQCPTLRDAVSQANSDSGDTIILPALSGQPYTLDAGNGELNLASDMTIKGAGANQVTISGGNDTRIFELMSGNVSISGVAITAGDGQGDESIDGGAINVGAETTLSLSDSTVSNSGTPGNGGGIYDAGTLNLTGSTITGNSAMAPDPGDGGGVYVDGTANLVNDTITGNAATGAGGGIYDNDTANVTNVTISGNSAPADSSGTLGGANVFVNDTTNGGFENTIVSNPQGAGGNCSTSGGFPTSGGHNLEDDAGQSCSFTDPTDQSGVDPKLGPLASNGGPTKTMALLAGSPAINAGATVASVTTDQRDGPRPQPAGGAYDIGAYEVGAVVDMAITKSASPSPATAGQPLTYTLNVTNNGPTSDPGYEVTVTDTLPSGVNLSSAAASQGSCSDSSGTLTCKLGTVDKGATATITIVVTPTAAGSLTNSASVSSSALDPNAANNSASVTTQVKTGRSLPPAAPSPRCQPGT